MIFSFLSFSFIFRLYPSYHVHNASVINTYATMSRIPYTENWNQIGDPNLAHPPLSLRPPGVLHSPCCASSNLTRSPGINLAYGRPFLSRFPKSSPFLSFPFILPDCASLTIFLLLPLTLPRRYSAIAAALLPPASLGEARQSVLSFSNVFAGIARSPRSFFCPFRPTNIAVVVPSSLGHPAPRHPAASGVSAP